MVSHNDLDAKGLARYSLMKAESYGSGSTLWLNPIQEDQKVRANPEVIRTKGKIWQ